MSESASSRGSFRSRRRPAAEKRHYASRRRWIIALASAAVAALIISTLIRVLIVDIYTVNQDSMAPTLEHGERIQVIKNYPGNGDVRAGDIVVFDGEGSFAPYRGGPSLSRAAEQAGHWFGLGSPPEIFVKRVIGTGGDLVICCTDDGELTVNGEPLAEEYLSQPVTPQHPASELEFEAEVPQGRMWVMGDHRDESVDSRALLGAPGGGMISEERILGRATSVVWPLAERRTLEGDRR